MELDENSTEEDVFKKLNENYLKLQKMVSDPFVRINLAGKMINSNFNNFEYFGDKHLVMEDFWETLSPEHRMALVGRLMNNNVVHFFYGRYREMFESLSSMINEYELQKKNGFNTENIFGTPDTTKPSYVG